MGRSKKPFLSIIIPTLNEEKYLPFLLESIEKQDFNNYEIIIADAGSQDDTLKFVENFKKVKGGIPAVGRNQGAKEASGEVLLFLDADLILPDKFLTDFLNFFGKGRLDIATSFIDGKKFDKLGFWLYNCYIKVTERFLAHASQIILVKKDIHEKVGGFNPKIKIAEDHIYAREAKKIGKFKVFKKPILSSSRRFEKDGIIRTFLKYVLAEIYMIFFGPIKKDIFNYKFDHYEKN